MTMYCKCVDYLELFVHCKHTIKYWSHRILNPRNVYPLIIHEKARLGPKKTNILETLSVTNEPNQCSSFQTKS